MVKAPNVIMFPSYSTSFESIVSHDTVPLGPVRRMYQPDRFPDSQRDKSKYKLFFSFKTVASEAGQGWHCGQDGLDHDGTNVSGAHPWHRCSGPLRFRSIPSSFVYVGLPSLVTRNARP